jgi:hypothetical protein
MPEQWPRALLRAALREAGYDAVGTRALGGGLRLSAEEHHRGPVGLVVLDQQALTGDRRDLEELRRRAPAPIVLLAPALRPAADGPWTRVCRRPFSIGDVVRTIEELVPLPPEQRHPID